MSAQPTDYPGLAEDMRAVPQGPLRILEVSDLTGVSTDALRFWEKKFPLRPGRSLSGQRLYSRADVRMVLRIKHLLQVEEYTIRGAQKRLGVRR